jgi:hypothetical protein
MRGSGQRLSLSRELGTDLQRMTTGRLRLARTDRDGFTGTMQLLSSSRSRARYRRTALRGNGEPLCLMLSRKTARLLDFSTIHVVEEVWSRGSGARKSRTENGGIGAV